MYANLPRIAVAHNGLAQNLLVLEQLVKLLTLREVGDERHGVLVLGLGIHELLEPAYGAHNALQLALAHALLFKVDELELDPPLLEVALRLFRIKTLLRPKDLYVHNSLRTVMKPSALSRFLAVKVEAIGHEELAPLFTN